MTTAVADVAERPEVHAPQAEAPPPDRTAPEGDRAAGLGDWLFWRVVRERGDGGHQIKLRVELHGRNPDRPAIEQALAWGPHAEALARRFAVGPAELERRRLARALDGARVELAAVERKAQRAALDKADALATLAGEKLTKALGRAEAALDEANGRLADSKRGLGVLERQLAQAAARSRREADEALARLDGEAARDVTDRLAARQKEVQAAVVAAAGPLLDELLSLMLAQECIVQRGTERTEKAAAVMARLNAEAPAEAPPTA